MAFTRATWASAAIVLCLESACSTDRPPVLAAPDDDDPLVPFRVCSEEPAWSPDGSAIAFTYRAQTADELQRGVKQLWIYWMSTGEVQYLTAGAWASWSPSGDRLVYTLDSDLWIFEMGSGEKRSIGLGPAFLPRWSPTGETIVFVRWSPSSHLWLVDADGTNLRDADVASFSVDWDPTGTLLVCSPLFYLLSGTFFGVLPDTLVDTTPAFCAYPRWAPDGSWIAYHRYSGGLPTGLRLVRPNGSEDHELIPGARRASWSPSAKELVYEHLREATETNEEYALRVYSMATGDSRPLFGE